MRFSYATSDIFKKASAERSAVWRKEKPDKRKAITAKYRAANREAINRKEQARRKANPELQLAKCRMRQTSLQMRTPAWVTAKTTLAFYQMARRVSTCLGVKHHVDHIIPLNGLLVSGLHIPGNLRILPARINARKHNKFETGA